VAVTIGLPELAAPSTDRLASAMFASLEMRLRELEDKPVRANDPFLRNTSTLARVLGLTVVEREVVRLAIVLELSAGLAELLHNPGPVGIGEVCSIAASALRLPERAVRAAFNRDGTLRATGLVSYDTDGPYAVEITTMRGLVERMLSGRRTVRSIMRLFVREAPTTKLGIANFAHAGEDVGATLRLVAGALRRRARGVNVLLHGPPGTGKTELVRTIAQALGARLYEVPDADDADNATPGRNRLSGCALAQRTLGRAPRTLLVFDEIEDVFRVRWEGALGLVRESGGHKSWTHRLLETSPLPTFWICNEVRQIEPATLRRFDLIVELRTPPSNVRLTMLRDALGTTPVEDDLLGRLAADPRLTPAHVARAVRVTRLMGVREPADVGAALSHVLTRNLAAQGPKRATSTVQLVCGPYDLDLVNTSTDLRLVTEAIAREKCAAVCLYGPPGTGKTAWAHHLSHKMGVPMRSARASDLIDCYVGETEKHLARLFTQARDEGALLFLDEADSFLQDRANARHSWEITQVNELLTQMESFEGVFICATNLVDSLDRASLRRFAMKVEFRPLRPESRWSMLLRLVPAATDDRAVRVAIDRLDGLTPGDFAAAARQARLAGAEGDAQAIVAMLERDLVLRRRGPAKAIGFGC
jgi:transitional endoplasmic reticulum ATPase